MKPVKPITILILVATIVFSVSCNQNKDSKTQSPPATPTTTEQPKSPGDNSTARLPTSPSEIPQNDIAKILNPPGISDNTLMLLTKYLTAPQATNLDMARDNLLSDIFLNEEEMPAKILAIQASIAKVARAGLYSQPLRDRVAFLQAGVTDKVKTNEYREILGRGVFIVGTGAALGTLAGSNAYRELASLGPKFSSGLQRTQSAIRDGVSGAYAGTRDAVVGIGGAVVNKESWQNMAQRTGEGVRHLRSSVASAGARTKDSLVYAGVRTKDGLIYAVRRPFLSTSALARRNLQDLGVTEAEQAAITEMKAVPLQSLPPEVTFNATPKATFQYSILTHLEGQDFGAQRVLALKQQRLIRGSPFETVYLTNPVPAELAEGIAGRIAAREVEKPERQFVHFANLKTKTISALRWPVRQFETIIDGTKAKIKPLFATFDWPTAVGTGITSSTAMAVAYWSGYGSGQSVSDENNALNLEALAAMASTNGTPGVVTQTR